MGRYHIFQGPVNLERVGVARFIRQLQTYQACGYDPSPDNDAYIAWKRKAKRDVAGYLRMWSDTTRFSPMNLYINR